MSGADISRRGFLALGAAVAAMPDVASGQAGRAEGPLSGASSPILDAVKFRKIEIAVGAARPFTVIHASDSHLNFMTVEDLIGAKYGSDLELYKSRRKTFDALPGLAAVLLAARLRKLPILYTGDLIDYESEANLEFARKAFTGADVLFTPGNHECVGHWGQKSPDWNECKAMRRRMGRFFPNETVVASRIVNGVNFVAFDNAGMSRDVAATTQFNRIRAEFEKGLPTVLMYHVPFYCRELRDALVDGKDHKPVKEEHLAWGYLANVPNGGTAAEKKIFEYAASRKNLKAALCGHLHAEFVCPFSDSVKQYVAGATYKGQAYEITFT